MQEPEAVENAAPPRVPRRRKRLQPHEWVEAGSLTGTFFLCQQLEVDIRKRGAPIWFCG